MSSLRSTGHLRQPLPSTLSYDSRDSVRTPTNLTSIKTSRPQDLKTCLCPHPRQSASSSQAGQPDACCMYSTVYSRIYMAAMRRDALSHSAAVLGCSRNDDRGERHHAKQGCDQDLASSPRAIHGGAGRPRRPVRRSYAARCGRVEAAVARAAPWPECTWTLPCNRGASACSCPRVMR